MDFKDTSEEAAFRDEARAWLNENIPTTDELEGLESEHAVELEREVFEGKFHTGRAAVVQVIAYKP